MRSMYIYHTNHDNESNLAGMNLSCIRQTHDEWQLHVFIVFENLAEHRG